jgi:hypothetical protein
LRYLDSWSFPSTDFNIPVLCYFHLNLNFLFVFTSNLYSWEFRPLLSLKPMKIQGIINPQFIIYIHNQGINHDKSAFEFLNLRLPPPSFSICRITYVTSKQIILLFKSNGKQWEVGIISGRASSFSFNSLVSQRLLVSRRCIFYKFSIR